MLFRSQGAVILAIEAELANPQTTLQLVGATVLSNSTIAGKQTLLVRVTEAGLKLLRINGTGMSKIRVSVAGDLNYDGTINVSTAGCGSKRLLMHQRWEI